ncbi:molecular chaperone [Nannochloropsis oceanica]
MDSAAGRIAILIPVLGVAICAGMAAFGFKGRVNVVGVDLGTTFSVVAVNEHGTVRVIKDKYGDPLVPSIVSFAPGGNVLVGKEARRRLALDPTHTIYDAKRFIGRDFDDPTVRMELERHPFSVIKHEGNYSGVGFAMNDETVTPEEVGAHVLRRLLDMTADYLGHRQVTKAVIAVPAKFNSRQKRATGEAYMRAGLKVMRVLEEPTAAAIAYGLHQKPNVHHILVYDFGGGTLDVSLLYVHEGFVTVEGIDGDDHLGAGLGEGKEALFFDDDGDIPSSNSTRSSSPHALHDCASYTMLSIAEHLKKRLSSSPFASFSCLSNKKDGGLSKNITVTRQAFEKACADVFARALAPVDLCLESNGMATSEIDEVVMVGGTTRIPKVREMLRVHLQVASLNTHIDPDITVAVGTACVVD